LFICSSSYVVIDFLYRPSILLMSCWTFSCSAVSLACARALGFDYLADIDLEAVRKIALRARYRSSG
jgi:hypothetical protein